MRSAKTTTLLLISAGLLAACGLRGPLYLPEDEESGKPATQQSTEKDQQTEKDRQTEKEKDDDSES